MCGLRERCLVAASYPQARSHAPSKLMCNALSLLHDDSIAWSGSYESVRRMPMDVINTRGWSCELHLYYRRKSSMAERSLLLVRPDVSEHCGFALPISIH